MCGHEVDSGPPVSSLVRTYSHMYALNLKVKGLGTKLGEC